jgi:hypothetical protein
MVRFFGLVLFLLLGGLLVVVIWQTGGSGSFLDRVQAFWTKLRVMVSGTKTMVWVAGGCLLGIVAAILVIRSSGRS